MWRGPTGGGRAGRAAVWPGCGKHPVVHVAYEDVESVREMGGQRIAHGGRVGIRRPRRPGWGGIRLGQRNDARRQIYGQ